MGGGQLESSTNPNSNHFIISLTTYPKRISKIHYTIYTLLNQTIKPDKIILWLSREEFPKLDSIPKILLDLCNNGLEIEFCQTDSIAHKKLIHTLEKYKNSVIITCDDDILYERDWLMRLIYAYKENPSYIHAHRAHKITFDKFGNIAPYLQWESCIDFKTSSPSFLNFPTGVGGVLYPPHCFIDKVFDTALALKLAPKADDIWFWACAVLNGTKINVIDGYPNPRDSFFDLNEVGTLWHKNVLEGGNDAQLNAILEAFPKLKEIIKFDSKYYWEARYKNAENGGGGGEPLKI